MNTIKSAGKQSKQMAKAVARQMAQEPFEVLKTVGRQVSGQEKSPSENPIPSPKENIYQKQKPIDEAVVKQKTLRRLEAHKSELEDIKNQKTFDELQKKISEGEVVPIENFSELSMEQKQVLKAQMEAVSKRKEVLATKKPLVEPSTKRGKGVLKGMAGKLEKMKKKAEIRMGPSG